MNVKVSSSGGFKSVTISGAGVLINVTSIGDKVTAMSFGHQATKQDLSDALIILIKELEQS